MQKPYLSEKTLYFVNWWLGSVYQIWAVKHLLLVCIDYLALNIKLPGGQTNLIKKRADRRAGKAASGRNDVVTSRTVSGRKEGRHSH